MLGLEGVRMALGSLWSRKLRSILTIFGVLIGIASVIAVTALGAAFEQSITGEFEDLDERALFVFASSVNEGEGPPDAGQFGTIFTDDDRAQLEALSDVEAVIPFGEVPVTSIGLGETVLPYRGLTATTAQSEFIKDADLYSSGGPFDEDARALVVGHDIAMALGGPAGITAGGTLNVTFVDGSEEAILIAGVLKEQEKLFGQANGALYVPLDVYYDVRGRDPDGGQTRLFDGFTIVATDATVVSSVQRDAKAFFRSDASDAHRLLQDDVRIEVQSADDIVDQIGAAFDQVTLFIVAIAGTSLLVGGVMIATIMLISVAERTKEIGVMKAIGGRDRDILWMFLVEAAFIGLLGSLLGIGVGLGAGYGLVDGLFGSEGVDFVVPWQWISISVAAGVGTGVIAGFIPARRATKVQPVEALSYE